MIAFKLLRKTIVRFGSKAEFVRGPADVRFTPIANMGVIAWAPAASTARVARHDANGSVNSMVLCRPIVGRGLRKAVQDVENNAILRM
jgi:hypothetical protein